MEAQDLLVGNLAISSLIIKTIISWIKSFATLKTWMPHTIAVVLGMLSAFVMGAKMFDIPSSNLAIDIVQYTFSGLFIAATSVGVHEVSKRIPTKGK